MKYIAILFAFFSFAAAQTSLKMFVEGEAKQEQSELVAKEVRDANGDVCAGLIIYSDLKGLSFQSYNGIVKVNSDPGKSFLFLSPDERVVEIFASGYTPLKIILNDIGIRLKSGQTWSLKITGDKKLDVLPVTFLLDPADATIFINGQNKGSNKTQQIPAGEHTLRVEKEGYKTHTQKITVSTANVLFNVKLQEVELQTVTISSVPDGAKIYLDNTDKGETNKQTFLYPESYNLKLTKSGFLDVLEKIEVKENGQNKFSFNLAKNVGTLVLDVTPRDAKVLINREDYTGKTTIELAPGRYKIEIEKTGYNGTSETVDITLGKRIDKTFSLIAKTGGLQFTVTPIDAKVLLKQNNTTVQQWEGAKIIRSLNVGDYELEVSANGYAPQRKRISVFENKTISEDVTLQKGAAVTNSVEIENKIKHNIDSLEIPGINFIFVSSGSVILRYSSESHRFFVSNPFYISKNKVTQNDWINIMRNNPSLTVNLDSPVNNVSWEEIQDFIEKLNNQSSVYYYRLPTELEWEYVVHNGFGINKIFDDINEWCGDWYDPYTFEKRNYVDTKGPKHGKYKVIKVCAGHNDSQEELNRKFDYPKSKNYGDAGFRLVMQIK